MMNLIIDTYTRKPHRLEAVQLTAENVDAVARWCGGKVDRNEKPGDPSDVSIHLLVPNVDGLLTALVGSRPFVVRDEDGRFWIHGESSFLDEYQKPTREGIQTLPANLQPNTIAPTPHYVARGAYDRG